MHSQMYTCSLQKPTWVEIGTHIGTTGRSVVPTNVPDGFFYVPLLQSLEALLNVSSIFHQVHYRWKRI